MRILAGCLAVAAGTVLVAQCSNGFHSRYGRSGLEGFPVRPGNSLTVRSGSDLSL
jgi:hypothetical protein